MAPSIPNMPIDLGLQGIVVISIEEAGLCRLREVWDRQCSRAISELFQKE